MKYYEHLRNVEDQIIRLDSVESILRVLGNSEANRNDMLNIIWYLDGAVEDINKQLSEKFYNLFNTIRDDERIKIPKEDMRVDTELTNIVNSWVRSEEC